MKQERIRYKDIKRLGFSEKEIEDNVYFNIHGFKYSIIEKKLTNKIYIDWDKSNGFCTMFRVDNKKDENILNQTPIYNIDHLEDIIDFFCVNKTPSNFINFS